MNSPARRPLRLTVLSGVLLLQPAPDRATSPKESAMPPEIDCARTLLSFGAHRGAAQVLFHAALQREAKVRAALAAWSPNGPIPLILRPANDTTASSSIA